MRNAFFTLITAVVLAGVAQAAPCTSGTLSSYIALGATGCDVGNFKFSHFDFLVAITNVNANNVTTNDIIVTPTAGPGGPAVDFAANWGTGIGILPSSYTATLTFRAESDFPFDKALTSNTLDLQGAVTGIGIATVAEVNCLGGLLNGGNLCLGGGITAGLTANIISGGVAANAALLYNPPVTWVDVVKNLTLTSAGTLVTPSSATLSHITETFGSGAAPAPEPSELLLFSTGIVLVILGRACRKPGKTKQA